MFFFTTGDLLKADVDALVNTVNCEGYMGKGIAYQFKLQFPENNDSYVKACKAGKLTPGSLHYFKEKNKYIINFPTKNKWREKSKMEYIDSGLDELVLLVRSLQLRSIAIPPLGSGNGGLPWAEVKRLIVDKLTVLAPQIDIYIYEPSRNFKAVPSVEPSLSASALILMEIKLHLNSFDKFRLQKAAYFANIFSLKKYFRFEAYKYGPYDHSIDIISKKIREFQAYYHTESTEEAKKILYNKIVSNSVNKKISDFWIPIQKSCKLVNSIESDHELECLATICFLIEQSGSMTASEIVKGFEKWSPEKAQRFSEKEILNGINKLSSLDIVQEGLLGYSLVS